MEAMQAYIQLDGRNNRNNASSPARHGTPPRNQHHGGVESELYNNSASRARYEAYSKLQASAVAFGESVPIPEIVAVGGQSDGKSSLLEALLGFRFNIREVEMGTRRPLMLQMIHDASAPEPRCRLQEEDSDDYGPAISSPAAVAEAIRSRTESFLKKTGTTVASKPIVMRAEYAFCPNLTIIDTPGFILKAKKGELESTPEDILAMVRELAAPQHRILLFLQQSSVEWCSSLWLDSIRAIDPTLSRTIVVVSKFDNRLQEFAERWEVDRYLSTGGYLGDNARPFFVALPKERNNTTSNDEFRRQIQKVDSEIVRHLRDNIVGGFDEEQFGNHIGFANLRKYLEVELQRRYRQSAPATLAILEQRCEEVARELFSIDTQLKTAGDVACLRRAGMMHAGAVAAHVVALLDGVSEPHPADWGRTTEEERAESRLSKWPGVTGEVRPSNAGLRMYGGAAFERVIDEFRCAACSLDCPPISRVEVANILLAQAGRAGAAASALTIARAAARSWLGPLLDTACDRLAHILSNLFDLALERIRIHESHTAGSNHGETVTTNLTAYIAFHAALRRAHQRFIRDLNKHCKDSVRDHLIAVTSPYTHQIKCSWESSNPAIFGAACLGSGYPQVSSAPFCLEAQDGRGDSMQHLYARAANDIEEEENFPPQGSQVEHLNVETLSPGKGDRCPLKESQQTVPETPSPEPTQQGPSKRKEYAISNGRLNLSKKKGVAAGLRLHNMNGGNKPDLYQEVCSLATEYFGKIREMLVKRTVPLTLNSGFLNPCRDRLSGEIGVELFAVTDDRFMEMFIAPGAVEQLELQRETLSKRCSTLSNCLNEFRALARSI
ncbi:unnamed protein product [Calypogeia fissa]